jgi:hypothetical protein
VCRRPELLRQELAARCHELVDVLEPDRVPRAWIDDQVCQADKDRLRISVRALRRRVGDATSWT